MQLLTLIRYSECIQKRSDMGNHHNYQYKKKVRLPLRT